MHTSEHIALIAGDVDALKGAENVLVRVDIVGVADCSKHTVLSRQAGRHRAHDLSLMVCR